MLHTRLAQESNSAKYVLWSQTWKQYGKWARGTKTRSPGRSDFQTAVSRQTSCSPSGTSAIKGLQHAPGPHLHLSKMGLSRAFSPLWWSAWECSPRPQLLELSGNNEEAWPCWRRCVTGFEVSKNPHHSRLAFSDSACGSRCRQTISYCSSTTPACWLPCFLPLWSLTHPLKLWTLNKDFPS